MVDTHRLQAKRREWWCGSKRPNHAEAHSRHDLLVHLIWIPKQRKPMQSWVVAIRVRYPIRKGAMEHEPHIIPETVVRDHVHLAP